VSETPQSITPCAVKFKLAYKLLLLSHKWPIKPDPHLNYAEINCSAVHLGF